MVALPNFNPVEGLITDAAGALTQQGQLRQLVAQTALQGGLVDFQGATAAGAAVWANTGIDLTAGKRLMGGSFSATVAGHCAIGLGTAAGVATIVGAGFSSGIIHGPSPPFGCDYAANTRVWVYSTPGAVVWWALYVG